MHYEILYFAAGSQGEEKAKSVQVKVRELIETSQGKITQEKEYGLKRLAYPIKKEREAYYFYYEFDLEGAKVKELREKLFLMPEVTRFVIVSAKIKTAKEIAEVAKIKAKIEEKEKEKISKQLKKDEEKEKEVAKPEPKKDKEKVSIEKLDEKLNELLGDIKV